MGTPVKRVCHTAVHASMDAPLIVRPRVSVPHAAMVVSIDAPTTKRPRLVILQPK
jgi:hypothetical protein